MNSGCICCSLVGDFGASLKEVISKYHPDRILIEPSGVGKLSDVIKAVQGVEEETGLVLNSYTTVVDAKKCKMYMRNFGEFFNNQVEYAGAIIMSRTDIVDEAKAQAAMELLREINPKAAIITTMSADAAMTMNTRSMSIIITTMSVDVDMIITIIMQMRYLQAGDVRQLRNIQERTLRKFLRLCQRQKNMELFFVQRECFRQKTEHGSTLIWFRKKQRSARGHRNIQDVSA